MPIVTIWLVFRNQVTIYKNNNKAGFNTYKNNLKIMNLKKGVGIDHCYKKQGNKL